MTEPPPALPPEDRLFSAIEADIHDRIAHLPPAAPLLDLALHRHCVDCGLPVVRYAPAGAVFDLGANREHVCPPDFGREARCVCGLAVRESVTGRVTELATGEPHDCEWTRDLGYRLALMPSPVLEKLVRAQARAAREEAAGARQAVEIPE